MALLVGCAGSDMRRIDTMQLTAGTDFTRALAAAYRYEAHIEAKVDRDWAEADALARKGLAAAAGAIVGPNVPREQCLLDECTMSADRLAVLEGARLRLMVYYANGSRERAPGPSAIAQAKFDCWLEEEEWGFSDSECRTAFLETEPLLKPPEPPVTVFVQVPAPQPALQPAPQPAAQPAVAPGPQIVKTYTVYFHFDKAVLTPSARKTLEEAAAAQTEINPLNVYLAGHTDTVGGDPYNDALSLKRVSVVARELGKMGVKTTVIDMKYFGKHKLQVATRDETSEPMNRRVEIVFEK